MLHPTRPVAFSVRFFVRFVAAVAGCVALAACGPPVSDADADEPAELEEPAPEELTDPGEPEEPEEPTEPEEPEEPEEPAPFACTGDPADSRWVTPPSPSPRVSQTVFCSAAAADYASFHVALPSSYDDDPTRSFPVLYFLHGAGTDGVAGIAAVTSRLGAAMDQGDIPAMILVFPHALEFGMYTDAKDGSQNAEALIMDDVIPAVDATYRTLGDAGRLIEGFSMGGHGAARLGLKHHTRFRGFSSLSGAALFLDFLEVEGIIPEAQSTDIFATVYGNDNAYYNAQNPVSIAPLVAPELSSTFTARLVIGLDDGLLATNQAFSAQLTALGVEHGFFEIDAGHSGPALLDWAANNDLGFYAAALGIDP